MNLSLLILATKEEISIESCITDVTGNYSVHTMKIYQGTFIHSKGPLHLELMENKIMGVDDNGTIVFIEDESLLSNYKAVDQENVILSTTNLLTKR